MTDAWCEVDGCPTSICAGPHHEVVTDLGVETMRADQKPLGQEVAPRWALCSDCNLVDAKTCLQPSPCWAPLTIDQLWERTL